MTRKPNFVERRREHEQSEEVLVPREAQAEKGYGKEGQERQLNVVFFRRDSKEAKSRVSNGIWKNEGYQRGKRKNVLQKNKGRRKMSLPEPTSGRGVV